MVTEFENKVYTLTSQIPQGKVSTYGAIARKLNTSPRAVGNALAKNPFAPIVPCHRVIKSNGEIGGFMGAIENTAKVALLTQEGIIIENDRVNSSFLY